MPNVDLAGPVSAVLVDRVSYQYPDGPLALGEISFQLQPGESVAIVGPNGAGKTTLFLALSGILTPKQDASCCGSRPESARS